MTIADLQAELDEAYQALYATQEELLEAQAEADELRDALFAIFECATESRLKGNPYGHEEVHQAGQVLFKSSRGEYRKSGWADAKEAYLIARGVEARYVDPQVIQQWEARRRQRLFEERI